MAKLVKILASASLARRPSGILRYIVVAIILLLALYYLAHESPPIYPPSVPRPDPDRPAQATKHGGSASGSDAADSQGKHRHPIDKLIDDAQHIFADLVSRETQTIEQAGLAYRKRRGRHPPPGFDKWYEFARSKNAVMVEDFFDQIYHDIEPFWGLEPATLRRQASQFEMTINIRNGRASAASDWFWTQIWLDLVQKIEQYLPDMDLALNPMDEPRLVVPWEQVSGFMKKAARTVKMPKADTVVSEFQTLPDPKTGELGGPIPKIEWENTKPYWAIARRGCAPTSPARKTALQESFAKPPLISTKHAKPHLYKGYVSNFTKSKDFCHQPDLQGLEGILIEPLSTSASDTMFPMFGGSKLTVNNEILLPAPMYWNDEERFTGGDEHGGPWADKENTVIWRGVATGGMNRESNWRGFQRHRFVAMANGTKVSLVESGREKPENFVLPEKQYNVRPQKDKKLGEWIAEWSDVGFIDLSCDPPQDGRCNYTDFYFDVLLGVKMALQFESKYLPDIDGNSFSGRYLGFLRSTSLPVKATLWREWHDSRLVPWKHFVPMDNRFSDYYGIMEYFLGYQGRDAHDSAAEKMASEGKAWAEKVLRKDDMLIYTLRLLLEYARVVDERREKLGWVDDLLRDPSLEEPWTSR